MCSSYLVSGVHFRFKTNPIKRDPTSTDVRRLLITPPHGAHGVPPPRPTGAGGMDRMGGIGERGGTFNYIAFSGDRGTPMRGYPFRDMFRIIIFIRLIEDC